ncbi:MAG: hypothetical protein PHO60_02580, partial [Methanothrix sp.]|nr:hypothetical protein [Methanothrix sp.]
NSGRASPVTMATVIAGGSGRWPQARWKALEGWLEGLSGDDKKAMLDIADVDQAGRGGYDPDLLPERVLRGRISARMMKTGTF